MKETQEPDNPSEKEDLNAGLPPFIKSWNQLYALVLGELVFLIFLFYSFTNTFS